MKFYLDAENASSIRELILEGSDEALIAIDDFDVDHLLRGATYVAFDISEGVDITQVLQGLNPTEIDADNATKAIFVIHADPSKLKISDLSLVRNYIAQYLPNADVRWAQHPNHNITPCMDILAVTTY